MNFEYFDDIAKILIKIIVTSLKQFKNSNEITRVKISFYYSIEINEFELTY